MYVYLHAIVHEIVPAAGIFIEPRHRPSQLHNNIQLEPFFTMWYVSISNVHLSQGTVIHTSFSNMDLTCMFIQI